MANLFGKFSLALRQLSRPETYYTGAALQERMDVLRLFLVTNSKSTVLVSP